MTTTWVVIAHRTGSRIFEHRGPGKGLSLVSELEHPAGRTRETELYSDKPGRVFESHGKGRHGYSPTETAHDRAAANLARKIADELESARHEKRFDQVVLVAEPKFLGMLRDSLGEQASKLVKNELHKDLSHVGERELPKHLSSVLAV